MACYRANFTTSDAEKQRGKHVAASPGRPGIAACYRDRHVVPRRHAPAEHPSPLTRRRQSTVTAVRDMRFSQQCCWNSKTAVKRRHVVGWVVTETSKGLQALNFRVKEFQTATLPTDP
jgi:hypothetical protein